ncbi:MAG: hypothetical protein EBU66_20320 [Bacteroidetes bacterium]|nr:hypothetical protein [Bacteroidota bacterium]
MPEPKLNPKGKTNAVKRLLSTDVPVLVLYYMNGCGHCEDLEPIWNRAVENIKPSDGIKIVAIEQAQMTQLPENLINHVAGFPTICVVCESKLIAEYHGPRIESGIYSFAKENMRKTKSASPAKKRKPAPKKNKSI